jgi:hypothetical protein
MVMVPIECRSFSEVSGNWGGRPAADTRLSQQTHPVVTADAHAADRSGGIRAAADAADRSGGVGSATDAADRSGGVGSATDAADRSGGIGADSR